MYALKTLMLAAALAATVMSGVAQTAETDRAPTRAEGSTEPARAGPEAQTLNRKCSTSPSLTTYSLPSARIFPASLALCSPL